MPVYWMMNMIAAATGAGVDRAAEADIVQNGTMPVLKSAVGSELLRYRKPRDVFIEQDT
ncbi:MAG: hypothetical protein U1F23_01510 [Lysobacterales bacterium]